VGLKEKTALQANLQGDFMTTEIAEPTAQAVTEEPAPSTEPTGAEPAQPAEGGEPGAPDTDPEPKPTDKQGAEPSGAEKRIKELVAKQRQAEREAAYWKGVAEGKAKTSGDEQEPADPKPAGKPTIEQYNTYDEYMEALADWKVEQKLIARQQENFKNEKQEHYKKRIATFQEKLVEAADEDPEILDYYQDQTLPISTTMGDVLLESEVGPQLLKYLGENRKEAARIARLSPYAAAKELGKIEDRILNPKTADPPKKISQAPDPISTVKPKGKITNPTDDEADIHDFIRSRNQAQFGKRG